MKDFTLDARLAADTVPVGDWALSRVLLMNDARFPWLVLVPRCGDCTELFDLSREEQQALIAEVTRASLAVRDLFASDKINVGSLGNIVPQLHIHVIGRRKDDVAWPGPVWGFGKAERYAPGALQTVLMKLATELAAAPI